MVAVSQQTESSHNCLTNQFDVAVSAPLLLFILFPFPRRAGSSDVDFNGLQSSELESQMTSRKRKQRRQDGPGQDPFPGLQRLATLAE